MPDCTSSLTPDNAGHANAVRLPRLAIRWVGDPGSDRPPYVTGNAPLSWLVDLLEHELATPAEGLLVGEPPPNLRREPPAAQPLAVYVFHGEAGVRAGALIDAWTDPTTRLSADVLNAALERRTHIPQAAAVLAE